jgi:hypothetical protein
LYDFANLTSVIYDDNNCGIEGFTARSNANGSTKENGMEQLLKINEKENLDKQHISYRIYPNPAVNEIYINSNKEKELVAIVITDVSGKILLNKNLLVNNYKTNLKIDLLNGIYFVNLINEIGERTTKKLVINK